MGIHVRRPVVQIMKYAVMVFRESRRRGKWLLGVSAACRESFRVFTFRTSFITQPAGPATYSQGKGRYSWIIFQKISPYNLLRRPVCYLSEVNSKGVKACRRLYGDRGWQPDVTQNPLWLFSDRPRPLRDVLHVEARDPLHVVGREAVQVERQAQRPTLRREGAVYPHIIVAHRNMSRDREGVYLWQIEFPPGQSDRRSEESAACGAHLVRRSSRYRRIPSLFLSRSLPLSRLTPKRLSNSWLSENYIVDIS